MANDDSIQNVADWQEYLFSVVATRATERGFATRSTLACGTASGPVRVQCASTLLRTTSPRSERARAATTLNIYEVRSDKLAVEKN